ncbi:hypothetical protein [Caldanaerobius polysaccharolyticus]|uniref:hypothetical protein n=1 Tax=Caldanaerobius polysaccharolyticus TaxID=44256 RepID=UPI00047D5836|nr:hypothetical protein [Caldanaerobius polysaccharolyticus]
MCFGIFGERLPALCQLKKSWFEDRWTKAKQQLIHELFGDSLTLEATIEGSDTLDTEMIGNMELQWAIKTRDRCREQFMFGDDILQLVYWSCDAFTVALTAEELMKGRWLDSGGYVDFYPFRGDKLDPKPQKGMKLGKVFRAFLQAYFRPEAEKAGLDDETIGNLIEWLVQQFSVLLGELRNQKVTVVVSLDPLDFLLASESTTGWRSCHALDDCYRAGNMAYMMDGYTAIAYAYQHTHDYMGHELPRKLWRQWVFIDVEHGTAFFQKQYPCEREQFSAVARRLVAHALAHKWGVEPNWTVSRNPVVSIINDSGLPYIDPTSSLIKLKADGVQVATLYISKTPPCPVCGAEMDNTEALACSSCTGLWECYACGEMYNEDELYVGADDNYYCERCWDERFIRCYHCDEVIWAEDSYCGADGEYYCEECWEDRFITCYHCGETIWQEDALEGADGNLYCRDCWEDRFVTCYCCEEVIWWDDAITGPYGYAYCDDCFYEYFVECANCGEPIERDKAVVIGHSHYCSACAKEVVHEEVWPA